MGLIRNNSRSNDGSDRSADGAGPESLRALNDLLIADLFFGEIISYAFAINAGSLVWPARPSGHTTDPVRS